MQSVQLSGANWNGDVKPLITEESVHGARGDGGSVAFSGVDGHTCSQQFCDRQLPKCSESVIEQSFRDVLGRDEGDEAEQHCELRCEEGCDSLRLCYGEAVERRRSYEGVVCADVLSTERRDCELQRDSYEKRCVRVLCDGGLIACDSGSGIVRTSVVKVKHEEMTFECSPKDDMLQCFRDDGRLRPKLSMLTCQILTPTCERYLSLGTEVTSAAQNAVKVKRGPGTEVTSAVQNTVKVRRVDVC